MNRFLTALCFASLTLLMTAADAATIPLVANGVNWGTSYYNPDVQIDSSLYDKTPNSGQTSPTWNRGGSAGTGTATATVIDNYLRLATTGNATWNYRIATGYTPSPNGGATVELRLRVVEAQSGALTASSMTLGNGQGSWTELPITATSFGPVTLLNLTEWTTIRLTLQNTTVANETASRIDIYVNGSSISAGSVTTFHQNADTNITNTLRFGDFSTGSVGGTTDWDYLRWTNTGAFAPIPEPGTLAILGIGGVIILTNALRRKN